MRNAVVVFLMCAGILVAEGLGTVEASDGPLIRVRIYDYANVALDTLPEAQRIAARFYAAIGVVVDWAPTFRPRARKGSEGEHGRLQDFTINILSRDMVARTQWPKDVIGTAVVAPEGGGRIAYVLYDRLEQAAVSAGWPLKELLAVVIAHELGHLLLPRGIRSDGLMRPTWDVTELRRTRARDLAFTPDEMAMIRQRLAGSLAAR
jgi:hypothetical protein